MTEESINAQVSSEKIEPDKTPNPTWGLVIIKGGSKIVSWYLSDPTVSCHVACNYGIKHAIETKPWNTAQKMVSNTLGQNKIPEETVPSLLGMEKSSSSPNPSTSKIGKPDSLYVINELGLPLMNEITVCNETSLPPSKETDVSIEHTSSGIKQDQSESCSLPVQESSTTQTNRKRKSLCGSSSRKESDESGSKQISMSSTDGKKISLPPRSPSSSKHNVKKSSSINSHTRNDTIKGTIRSKEVKDIDSDDAKIKPEKVEPGLQTVEGTKRRSFKRRAVDGGKMDGSAKVVLRPQSLETNKVTWCSNNDLITETAGKLTELRNRKVKALVNAFETFMFS